MGRVIAKAYLDAYINISEQFPNLPKSARESNPVQAMEVIRPARLLANPRDTNQAVRSLDVGMLLYPTGKKEDIMLEVKDELGYLGWVSAEAIQIAGRGNTRIVNDYENDDSGNLDNFDDDSEEWEELR